jgi:hypothetical protein
MKQIPFLWTILLIICVGSIPSLQGQQSIVFNAGTRIQTNGVDMMVDQRDSAPCIVDWNEDGKKDLLIGCWFNGNIHLFFNSGSNSTPIFTTSNKLQADGTELKVSFG